MRHLYRARAPETTQPDGEQSPICSMLDLERPRPWSPVAHVPSGIRPCISDDTVDELRPTD